MIHETSFKTYAIGFIASLALTMLAFVSVAKHLKSGHEWPAHPFILYILLGLALVQFAVQLIYFLHLGMNEKQRLNLVIFTSTISIVVVIVFGSIWIMNNLNYNMTPQDMDSMLLKEEGMTHE